MRVSRKHARILLEYLTIPQRVQERRVVVVLGLREGLSAQRVYQIISKAKSAIGYHADMTVAQVGALLRKKAPAYHHGQAETPEDFHEEVENERHESCSAEFLRSRRCK